MGGDGLCRFGLRNFGEGDGRGWPSPSPMVGEVASRRVEVVGALSAVGSGGGQRVGSALFEGDG